MPKNKVKFEYSAGGVVYRITDEGKIQVLLVAVKNGTVWTIPKGLIEKGESKESTAIREVKEEGGVDGEIVDFIDKIEYWYVWPDQTGEKVKRHKTVYYYLLKYKSGDPAMHDYEVDDANWFDIDDAIKVVKYPSDKKILKKAKDLIEKHLKK